MIIDPVAHNIRPLISYTFSIMDTLSSLKRLATQFPAIRKRAKTSEERRRKDDESTPSETPNADSLSSLEIIPREIFFEMLDYAPQAVPHLRMVSCV